MFALKDSNFQFTLLVFYLIFLVYRNFINNFNNIFTANQGISNEPVIISFKSFNTIVSKRFENTAFTAHIETKLYFSMCSNVCTLI